MVLSGLKDGGGGILGSIHLCGERGKWESQAKGVVQVTARSVSSWSIICVYQEMTFSGCDVGTSSLINFLGGRLPGQRSRAKMAPDPVGDGHGERGWD